MDREFPPLQLAAPHHMPPPTDVLVTLLDRVQESHNLASRAEVWRLIGVSPKRGRDFLTRSAAKVDWPIFFTLRAAVDAHQASRLEKLQQQFNAAAYDILLYGATIERLKSMRSAWLDMESVILKQHNKAEAN